MAGIYAEKSGNNIVPVEPGTYVARCYSIIEIGTYDWEYNGKTSRVHKARITWELPTELTVFKEERGEEPFVISKEYNLSMHEQATLRKDLERWRSRPFTEEEAVRFDITKLLGKECLLTVIHKQKKTGQGFSSVVDGIGPLMKNQICPPQINPSQFLCFEDFDWELFAKLPDWLKDKIRNSDEFKQLEVPEDVKEEEAKTYNPLIDPNKVPF